MDFRNFKIIASLIIVLFVSACGEEPCIRRTAGETTGDLVRECGAGKCIDADDWGYPKVWVPASSDDPVMAGHITGPVTNQYAEGIDSKQVIIDADKIPLVITIGKRDEWTSWFGGDINTTDDGLPDPSGYSGGESVPDRECEYKLTDGHVSSGIDLTTPGVFGRDLSPTTLKFNKSYDGTTGHVCNPVPNPLPSEDLNSDCIVPCYYRHGMGLFVGLAPNKSTNVRSNEVVLAYHIPDAKAPDGRTFYRDDPAKTAAQNYTAKAAAELRDGYLVRGLPSVELPGSQTGDRLFFKIVDRTYLDNSGGYHVKIKEGTRSADKGPLEKIVSIFMDPINIVMKRIYNGIVSSHAFISFVQALLALYITFFGYNIMIGGTDALKKDIFVRIFKVGLIMTLISESSWDFFYNHLFVVFLDGVQGISAALMNPFGDFDPNSPWYSMDQVLAKLWSSETWTKISATLISNAPLSLLFIPAMFYGIIMFMIALVKALIIYLTVYATIAILVILAPIFLIFMLFERTKQLTKEWYDQMFVAALQQIILMAALGMFAAVIVMYLQKAVGYTVCWNIWLDAKFGDLHLFNFKFWMADVGSSSRMPIWIDGNGDGIKELVTRNIDAPYLDPVYDKALLSQMENYKYWSMPPTTASLSYYYISFTDLLFFIGSILLMQIFMPLVQIVATTLKSGSAAQSSNVFGAGNNLSSALNSAIRGDGKGGGLLGGTLDGLRSAYGAASGFGKTETGQYITRNALNPMGKAMANSRVGKAMSGVAGSVKNAPGMAIGGVAGAVGKSIAGNSMVKTRNEKLAKAAEEKAYKSDADAKSSIGHKGKDAMAVLAGGDGNKAGAAGRVFKILTNDGGKYPNGEANFARVLAGDPNAAAIRASLKAEYNKMVAAGYKDTEGLKSKMDKLMDGEATTVRPSAPIAAHQDAVMPISPATDPSKPKENAADALRAAREAQIAKDAAAEQARLVQLANAKMAKAEEEKAAKAKQETKEADERRSREDAMRDYHASITALQAQLRGLDESNPADKIKINGINSQIAGLKKPG